MSWFSKAFGGETLSQPIEALPAPGTALMYDGTTWVGIDLEEKFRELLSRVQIVVSDE